MTLVGPRVPRYFIFTESLTSWHPATMFVAYNPGARRGSEPCPGVRAVSIVPSRTESPEKRLMQGYHGPLWAILARCWSTPPDRSMVGKRGDHEADSGWAKLDDV